MKHVTYMMFAFAGGLTLSGIIANGYRLVANKPRGRLANWIYYLVMVMAGPSVLIENSTRSFRKKDCSRLAYGFAMALASYWAFVLGLVIIDMGMAI